MSEVGSAADEMTPAVRRVRAYFAPVGRTAGTPTIFDPARDGMFALDAPPAPWMDLGWIHGFARQCGTKVEPLKAGAPSVTQAQVRTEIEATVSFRFASWGKLQLALAGGSQQMNLLKGADGVAGAGSGGSAVAAVPGGVSSVLTLATPLPAGVPSSGMKVSAMVGFCDREGSSFFQEWSGVFVAEGQQGERVIWHYPRLQAASGAEEHVDKTAGGLESVALAGRFRALPVRDPVDGETVVCFRSFVTGA